MLTKWLAPDVTDGPSLSFKNLIRVARQRHQIRALTGWRRARAAVPPDAETVDCSIGSTFNQRKRWEQAIKMELKKCPPKVILSNGIAPKKWWPQTVVICGPEEPPQSHIDALIANKRRKRLNRAAFIVATTSNVASTLIQSGIDSRRIKIIPCALDTRHPKQRKRDSKRVRLLVPGHIAPGKGQDVLIDAFARLRKNKKDMMLRIVGDTRDQRYLEQLRVQAHGLRVQFITKPIEFSDHFEWADMALLPRHTQGSWSSRALESMMHGCPVIWSENPNTREATGGKGVICPEFTAEAFKAAIEQASLSAIETSESGKSARDYIMATHDSRAVWKRIETVLEHLNKSNRWD